MKQPDKTWQPPDRLAPGKKRIAWQRDIIDDSESWLRQQPFWNDLSTAENIIRGKEMMAADQNRSGLTSNRLKRIGREMVAAISDVRYPEDVWHSENRAYANELTMFSKLARAVWYEARAPYSVRRLTQWFMLGGTGYLWPIYKRRRIIDPDSMGEVFEEYSPRDVLPFQIDQRDWQETYAVTFIKMVSLYKAHSMFPLYQDKIRPVSKERQQSSVVSARMNLIASLRGENTSWPGADQMAEVSYTLVRDLSFNTSDMPIPMGDAGASWSYVVPPLRTADQKPFQIPSRDVASGKRTMRDARLDDCRLYPNMRLIIGLSGVNEPVYDGPAWAWHGMYPPRFCSDDWVTEPMGLSIFRDVFDIERARQFTERAVDMKIRAQMDPGMMYDSTQINPGTAEELDPWKMRARLGVDGEVDKALTTIIPAELMKVGAEPGEWIKYLSESQDYYLGVNQLSQLAKAKMSTGQEGADDLLRMAGPIVRDICAGEEVPMADVLEMEKYDILQNFNTARVMEYVGPDGVTPETFDFDPANIVPAHMPGEDAGNPSQFSRMERAKHFARQLRLTATPGYLHGIPQTAQKLLLLQGVRAGLPISPRRVLKDVFGIANVDQEIKEWQDFRLWQLELAQQVKAEGLALGLADAGAGAQGGGGGGKKPGRPPSGNKPPAARTKGSAEGPRAVVSESG
ncbi:MAG: hypothetical protein WB870_11600 [Gallionellaceae bacterium]